MYLSIPNRERMSRFGYFCLFRLTGGGKIEENKHEWGIVRNMLAIPLFFGYG
jgi:hypothetical protein